MPYYEIKSGSITRGEDGRKVTYRRGGPPIEMTREQAATHGTRVVPYYGPEPGSDVPGQYDESAGKAAAKPKPVAGQYEKEPAASVEEPTAKPEVGPYDEVLAGNVGEVAKALERMSDPAEIRALMTAEEKTGQKRKGVASAGEDRLAALEAAEKE